MENSNIFDEEIDLESIESEMPAVEEIEEAVKEQEEMQEQEEKKEEEVTPTEEPAKIEEQKPVNKKKKLLQRVLIAILILLLSLLLFLVASEVVTAIDPNCPWAVRYRTIKELILGKRSNSNMTVGGQTESGLTFDPNATDAPKPDAGGLGISDRSVFFSGIDNAVVNNDSVVYLDNPEENIDFYMQYKIYEGDVEIYSTNLIAPGQYVTWEIGGQFSVGEHTLLFTEIPYYQISDDEWMQLTTGVNEVVFTVIE